MQTLAYLPVGKLQPALLQRLLEQYSSVDDRILVGEEAIPIVPATVQLCREYALEPLGTIAPGFLLLTLPPSDTTTVIAELRHQGFQIAVIGKIVADDEGRTLWKEDVPLPLPIYHQDEITKIFV